MSSPNPSPVQQHFVPAMLLKHFTDERGQLWCWRREMKGKLYQSVPENAFKQRHIYTRFVPCGEKDYSLEEHWQSLETNMEPVLARILRAVRQRAFPNLRHDDWVNWLRFYYALRSRSPLEVQEHSRNLCILAQAELMLEECHAVEGVSADFLRQIPPAHWFEKEAILRSQAFGPSLKAAEILKDYGLLILRVVNPSRSLIIGDRPGAKANIRIGFGSERQTLPLVPVA
jgi:hypothetical protein